MKRLVSPEDKNYDRLVNTPKQIFDVGFTQLADKPLPVLPYDQTNSSIIATT